MLWEKCFVTLPWWMLHVDKPCKVELVLPTPMFYHHSIRPYRTAVVTRGRRIVDSPIDLPKLLQWTMVNVSM